MCVDSLLLTFNSDEKQLIRLLISSVRIGLILVPVMQTAGKKIGLYPQDPPQQIVYQRLQ